MYQGKHHKRSHRRSGKSAALLVSLLLILTVTVGGTIAFLMDSDGPLHNLFNPSKVTTKVVEDVTIDPTKKQDVKIQNTGDTDAWIRATVIVTWQDEDGNVYGQAPVKGTAYTDWTPGINWLKGDHGFYYYTKPVGSGAITPNALLTEISLIGVSPAEGYYLTVEIIGSGIQSEPAYVFNTEWVSSGLIVNTKDKQGNELPPEQWTLTTKSKN